jgi:hypothetical protein
MKVPFTFACEKIYLPLESKISKVAGYDFPRLFDVPPPSPEVTSLLSGYWLTLRAGANYVYFNTFPLLLLRCNFRASPVYARMP